MRRPVILVKFEDGGCTWNSCGWKHDRKLMAAAKKAINEGETEDEVKAKLDAAGFIVMEEI